jgi:hypothetical protein
MLEFHFSNQVIFPILTHLFQGNVYFSESMSEEQNDVYILCLHYMDYGTSEVRKWHVLEVLAAQFADPNPGLKAVEHNIRAKQINDLKQHKDICLLVNSCGSWE